MLNCKLKKDPSEASVSDTGCEMIYGNSASSPCSLCSCERTQDNKCYSSSPSYAAYPLHETDRTLESSVCTTTTSTSSTATVPLTTEEIERIIEKA